MFTRVHILAGVLSLLAAVSIGWLAQSLALGIIVTLIAGGVIFYLAWERSTLGEDAGDRENSAEPGEVPHTGIIVYPGGGGGL